MDLSLHDRSQHVDEKQRGVQAFLSPFRKEKKTQTPKSGKKNTLAPCCKFNWAQLDRQKNFLSTSYMSTNRHRRPIPREPAKSAPHVAFAVGVVVAVLQVSAFQLHCVP